MLADTSRQVLKVQQSGAHKLECGNDVQTQAVEHITQKDSCIVKKVHALVFSCNTAFFSILPCTRNLLPHKKTGGILCQATRFST